MSVKNENNRLAEHFANSIPKDFAADFPRAMEKIQSRPEGFESALEAIGLGREASRERLKKLRLTRGAGLRSWALGRDIDGMTYAYFVIIPRLNDFIDTLDEAGKKNTNEFYRNTLKAIKRQSKDLVIQFTGLDHRTKLRWEAKLAKVPEIAMLAKSHLPERFRDSEAKVDYFSDRTGALVRLFREIADIADGELGVQKSETKRYKKYQDNKKSEPSEFYSDHIFTAGNPHNKMDPFIHSAIEVFYLLRVPHEDTAKMHDFVSGLYFVATGKHPRHLNAAIKRILAQTTDLGIADVIEEGGSTL